TPHATTRVNNVFCMGLFSLHGYIKLEDKRSLSSDWSANICGPWRDGTPATGVRRDHRFPELLRRHSRTRQSLSDPPSSEAEFHVALRRICASTVTSAIHSRRDESFL